MDYFPTWTFKRLAAAEILSRLRPLAEQRGRRVPVVCTSLQLVEGIEYEG